MEGRTFGEYIMKHKPDGKIGVLYQNDDYGKDFLTGLKAGLGDKNKPVAEVSFRFPDRSPEGRWRGCGPSLLDTRLLLPADLALGEVDGC
jgi:hypothetical protein